MISEIKENLFHTEAKIIVHGCNCRGAFGYGVAGIIARLYPEIKNAYMDKYEHSGWELGEVQFVETNDGKHIFANAATQLNYGNSARTKICYCSYDAIETCLINIEEYAASHKMEVAIPKIGAGLAGGDWIIIRQIIEKVFSSSEVLLTIYYID